MRCPTLLTSSASRLVLEVMTLFFERKFWYSVVAMACTSGSGNNLNCFRPVITFLEQAIINADKRKIEKIFRTMWQNFENDVQ
jgi:hypothetical protein